jgi:hypothetical protein
MRVSLGDCQGLFRVIQFDSNIDRPPPTVSAEERAAVREHERMLEQRSMDALAESTGAELPRRVRANWGALGRNVENMR